MWYAIVIGSGIGGMGTLFEQIRLFFDRGPSRISPFLVPMMIPDTAGGVVAIRLGIRGPNMAVVAACATGNYAIGQATEIIRRGQTDNEPHCLVEGVRRAVEGEVRLHFNRIVVGKK